jgi:predicted PurR-regulated permease PerM
MTGLSVFLITAASFVVVVAGMKAAASIIVPFLLAVFISIICVPPLVWLKGRKVPGFLAVLIVLAGILIFGSFLLGLMGSSLADFSGNLPQYQQRLADKSAALFSWLSAHGLSISTDVLKEHFDPGAVMKIAANTFAELSGALTNAFMIMLIVLFILFEVADIPGKIRAAVRDPEKSLAGIDRMAASVNRYLAIKTIFSIATGVCVGLWLWILGVDYALLWGVLAFVLNFIPNIGSIIAAIPAILLAIIQLGLGHALLATLGYVVINGAFGNILEPRFMGRGLGLSTLVVLLSLIFWGWVLGPVGMLLSVPLTMVIKIAMEGSDETRWFAVLIGGRPPKGEV